MLEGIDLACRRGGRLVFEGLDLAVAPGGLLVVTGPNGSGKSSLLRLLAGLIAPAEGEVRWHGRPAAGDPDAFRDALHYQGHADAVKPALGVAENLAFWVRLRGAAPGAVGPALAAVGLAHAADLPAAVLSAGQRRRLALARLAAIPAELWLLDEPTAALDADGTAALGALVERHCAAGGIAVVSTHLPLPVPGAASLDMRTVAVAAAEAE